MTLITNKMNAKSKYIVIFVFILLAIVYLFLAQTIGNKRDKRLFNHFYKSEIIGKLEYAKISNYGVAFKIEGIEGEFKFHPYTSKINNNKIFYNIANKGDLIIKPKYSDTLTLKKGNNVYLYTFYKYE